jgi:hypothetical protein
MQMINKPKKDDEKAWLEFVNNPKTVHIAVVDADCPISALRKAIELFPDELNQIAFNPEAPSELLEIAYSSKNVSDWHRRAIVEHKNVTLKILAKAILHKDEDIRVAVATNTKDLAQIKELAKESSQSIRVNLAENPHTPSEVLEILIKPYARHIAARVLENPNCTEAIFKQIAKMPFVDKDDTNISGYWVTDPLLGKAPISMLTDIFERSPHRERHYVFKNPNATIEMIREVFDKNECIYDTNSMNALLRRNDLPNDLILLAMKKVRKDYVTKFAYMPRITKPIVDALLKFKSKEINLALIGNQSIDGETLMPLVKAKSREILVALAKRTYPSGYDKETRKNIEVPYKDRESLWEVVDPLVSKDSRFHVSLILHGQPCSQTFEQAEWLDDDDSEVTIEIVQNLLYSNNEHEGISIVISHQALSELKVTPLSDLLDFISEDENGSESDLEVFEESKLDDSGFEILEYEVDSSGDLEVYYYKWVQFSFSLKASSLSEVKNACISYIPKHLELWDESVSSTLLIHKIIGSAGKVGEKLEAIEEQWYLDDSLA